MSQERSTKAMQTLPPLVSIVMPMRNAEQYVAEALKSILAETEVSLEVVVVNDKSTDRSLERVLAIQDKRIRVVDGPGKGFPTAVNTGFRQARGSIVMQCDADDLYPSERIRQQVEWLQNHPDYDGVCGAFATVDDKGQFITDMYCGAIEEDIAAELAGGKTRTSFCTYAVRASLIEKIGGYRSYFEIGPDLDFQFRLGEAGRIGYVPRRWYFYRIHATSMTHTARNVVRERYLQIARLFQEQRKATGQDDLERGCPPAKPSGDDSAINTAREHIGKLLLGRAWDEYRAGQKAKAMKTGWHAVTVTPLSWQAWRSVLALTVKSCRRIPQG